MHGDLGESRDGAGKSVEPDSEMAMNARPKHGGWRPGAGRKPAHSLRRLRSAVTALTTKRLDGRSAVAIAVRKWKDEVRRDLGGDLSRAQETILEAAAQSWVIVSSLDDWIARQPSLVSKKRALLPVVVQRMQIAEGLARQLDRLGLDRKAKPMPQFVFTSPGSWLSYRVGWLFGAGLTKVAREAQYLTERTKTASAALMNSQKPAPRSSTVSLRRIQRLKTCR